MRLYPRHRLDLRGRHLAYGLAAGALARRPDTLARRIEMGLPPGALVCFSVRSAFELLLDALALEAGSEVLVSAVTHPDMPRIIERHDLVAVPVDVDLATMAPEVAALELSVTERTRALLVAHLFGARFDMDPLVAFAKARGLFLWEDCAQALRRPDDPGDQRADVSLFSFGSIKTATALGGAVVYIRDPDVLGAMRERQSAWPLQQRGDYVRRLLRFSALTGLGNPAVYGVAVAAARRRGLDVDELVNGCVRALHPPPGDDDQAFARWARRRPSPPLLALLARRLASFDDERLRRRAARGEAVAAVLPPELLFAGRSADERTHWVIPLLTQRPVELIERLRRAGFDTTRATSGMAAVSAPAGRPEVRPSRALRFMDRVVFVPAYPELSERAFARLLCVLGETGSSYASGMHTIELTPDELRLVREAVRAFLNDFGHEEQDVVNALRSVLAKIEAARAEA